LWTSPAGALPAAETVKPSVAETIRAPGEICEPPGPTMFAKRTRPMTSELFPCVRESQSQACALPVFVPPAACWR
jgi:hypothetical protein